MIAQARFPKSDIAVTLEDDRTWSISEPTLAYLAEQLNKAHSAEATDTVVGDPTCRQFFSVVERFSLDVIKAPPEPTDDDGDPDRLY